MAFQNIISNLFSKKKDFNYLDDLVNSGKGEVKYRLAQLRNDADSAIYAAEKFIFDPEFRDQIPPFDIDGIENLIVELKQSVDDEDVIQITVKTKELKDVTTEIRASFY